MADHRVQTPGYDEVTAPAEYPHATERPRAGRPDRTLPAIATIVALLLIIAVIVLA